MESDSFSLQELQGQHNSFKNHFKSPSVCGTEDFLILLGILFVVVAHSAENKAENKHILANLKQINKIDPMPI